jgi:hypothetical protein
LPRFAFGNRVILVAARFDLGRCGDVFGLRGRVASTGEGTMQMKFALLIASVGAFLTFAFIDSTELFDPQPFGIALMIAGLLSAVTDLVHFAPRHRWLVAFDRPETVLPRSHRH